jgi:SAM-dependent methyltransferase
MTIKDALSLIQATSLAPHTLTPSTWADLGCGSGLFTRALAQRLTKGSTIYAIDTKPQLQQQTTPGGVTLLPLNKDFEKDNLNIYGLDGILMANSLHYIKDKPALIRQLQKNMQPQGPFLIIEYDTDQPVPAWVPYPLSFSSLQSLFHSAGYRQIKKIGERPSVYGRANIYAAFITDDPNPLTPHRPYSTFRFFTGLIIAVLTACTLTVSSVITNTSKPVPAYTRQSISLR